MHKIKTNLKKKKQYTYHRGTGEKWRVGPLEKVYPDLVVYTKPYKNIEYMCLHTYLVPVRRGFYAD